MGLLDARIVSLVPSSNSCVLLSRWVVVVGRGIADGGRLREETRYVLRLQSIRLKRGDPDVEEQDLGNRMRS